MLPWRFKYVYDLSDSRCPSSVGNKASGLRRLMQHGFRVPITYVCTWDAYTRYFDGGATRVMDQVSVELATRVDAARGYAVRSSANLEDSFKHSFAGQFKTFLNVFGLGDMLQAIQAIWQSTRSQGVQAYLQRRLLAQSELKMAVIVQEMVTPVLSGVAFSKNPMTGMDEVVVEAVEGSGEALVQAGETPLRWVHKWGDWTARPDGGAVDLAVIDDVVQQTRRLAGAFRQDIDAEWVYDGRQVHWVQAREITAVKDVPVYSNRIAREMLPGLIKPLVWSINVPMVCGAWVDLVTEAIGSNELDPDNLAKPFYYRAYFNMGALGQVFESIGMPRESLETMMGIQPPAGTAGGQRPRMFKPTPRLLRRSPRLSSFAVDKLRFGRKVDAFLPEREAVFRRLANQPLEQCSEMELLDQVDRLYPLVRETAYYNIVAPLLMFGYNAMLKAQLRKLDVDFEAFDLAEGREDIHRFDPGTALAQLHAQYAALDAAAQQAVDTGDVSALREMPGAESFRSAVADFVERFGHLSDSGNDFSVAPWRESPSLVLKMIAAYQRLEQRGLERVRLADLPVRGMKRRWLSIVCGRARQFRYYREFANYVYSFGYGLFRRYFLSIGDRLAARSVLGDPADVFYLRQDEVREVVAGQPTTSSCATLVSQRREEMERCREAALPAIIFGDQPPPMERSVGETLRGTPTSRGYYTGRVRVVRGIQDIDKVQPGDVLVVPYSDIGWTPLYARAGAVVAESGGLLSHSSIIAREYNIPAVVSVPDATLLADGVTVSVDGYSGTVAVHSQKTS